MDIPVDQLVDRYIKLRDKVERLKKQHKEELEPIQTAMVQVEKFLLGHLQTQGVDSMKTAFGTPYVQTFRSVSVGDKAEYLNWVRETGNWEALDVRALKEPIIAYKEEHQDLPPGIKYSESKVLNVTRPVTTKT
jgi:hypothetical protein